jgi:hypothetical protein
MSMVHTFVRIPQGAMEELYTAVDQTIAEGMTAPLAAFVRPQGITLEELASELGEITVQVERKRMFRRERRSLDPAPALVIQAVLQRLAEHRRVRSCEITRALAMLREGSLAIDTSGVPGLPQLWGAIDGTLQRPPRHLAATELPSYSLIPPPLVRAVAAAAQEVARRCAPGDDFLAPALTELTRFLLESRSHETIVVMAS